MINPKRKPLKIGVIPDCQVKPGVPLEHLTWAGRYFAEKRPDVIVCLGDFADMESLSEWDKGKLAYEGRRYANDIDAVHCGLELFNKGLKNTRGYKPKRIFTLGNHEDRIRRAIESDAKLHGTLS